MIINVEALLWTVIMISMVCLILSGLSVFFNFEKKTDMAISFNVGVMLLCCVMLVVGIYCLFITIG